MPRNDTANRGRDWDALRREYEMTDITRSQLIQKYGIPEGTLRSRMAREGWRKEKKAQKTPLAPTPAAASQGHPRDASRDANPKHGLDKAKYCGARKRQGDHTPCQRPAGWGTPHPGTGRCKLHGGCTPVGEPGNKAALKTGEYESILLDVLPAEDQEAWHRVNTEKLAQLDNEIRATEIRERRMLERIERLRREEYTMVAYDEESTTVNMDAGALLDAGVLSDRDVEENPDGQMSMPGVKIKRKYEGTLGQIQAIEEALTRVQAHKARLLKIKNDFEELDLRRQESAMKNW